MWRTGAPQGRVDLLALGFIAVRLAYIACYLVADRASLRSVVWLTGLGLSIALFVVGRLGGDGPRGLAVVREWPGGVNPVNCVLTSSKSLILNRIPQHFRAVMPASPG